MDKAHSLSSPMVVQRYVKNDPFHSCKNGENLLGLGVPYLSAISAPMYLTYSTRLDIVFHINLLARFSSAPT